MTVSVTPRKAGPFAGDGAQLNFDFTFKIFATTDVVVTKASTVGVESILLITTDYSVIMNADQNASPGGRVTVAIAPVIGEKITLSSIVPESQGTSLPTGSNWQAKIVENALDKVTVLVSQLREILGRTVRQPISDTTLMADMPTLANRASKFFAFDAAGNPIASTGALTGVAIETTIQVLDTIAALKALTLPGVAVTYLVRGYAARGDGGGGFYFWNAADATADNGGTILQLNAGGNGRFNKLF